MLETREDRETARRMFEGGALRKLESPRFLRDGLCVIYCNDGDHLMSQMACLWEIDPRFRPISLAGGPLRLLPRVAKALDERYPAGKASDGDAIRLELRITGDLKQVHQTLLLGHLGCDLAHVCRFTFREMLSGVVLAKRILMRDMDFQETSIICGCFVDGGLPVANGAIPEKGGSNIFEINEEEVNAQS